MSSMSIGREGAICEIEKIMQILPGSSDDAVLVSTSQDFCKMARARIMHSELKIQKLQPLPHPEQ
jgi:hypothetical protein